MMTVQAWCDDCGTHIYNLDRPLLSGDVIEASRFTPASPEIPQPTSMSRTTCPVCDAPLFHGNGLAGHSRGSIRFEDAA